MRRDLEAPVGLVEAHLIGDVLEDHFEFLSAEAGASLCNTFEEVFVLVVCSGGQFVLVDLFPFEIVRGMGRVHHVKPFGVFNFGSQGLEVHWCEIVIDIDFFVCWFVSEFKVADGSFCLSVEFNDTRLGFWFHVFYGNYQKSFVGEVDFGGGKPHSERFVAVGGQNALFGADVKVARVDIGLACFFVVLNDSTFVAEIDERYVFECEGIGP